MKKTNTGKADIAGHKEATYLYSLKLNQISSYVKESNAKVNINSCNL